MACSEVTGWVIESPCSGCISKQSNTHLNQSEICLPTIKNAMLNATKSTSIFSLTRQPIFSPVTVQVLVNCNPFHPTCTPVHIVLAKVTFNLRLLKIDPCNNSSMCSYTLHLPARLASRPTMRVAL